MGITIHYDITFEGAQKQLEKKLTEIRNICLDLPFSEVEKVKSSKITQNHINIFNWLQRITTYPNNSKENLEMRDLIMKELGFTTWIMIELGYRIAKPTTLVWLGLWPGEGCENCDLQFAKKGKKWVCQSFCKTQFSTDIVAHHLLVIGLLKTLQTNGFTVDVCDEGEYWETGDIEKLANNVNCLTEMISGLVSATRDQCPDGMTVESPIDQHKNIIKVKKKGR